MEEFDAVLTAFLQSKDRGGGEMNELLQILCAIPKNAAPLPNLAGNVLRLFHELLVSENEGFALKLIQVLSHYENIMGVVLECEQKSGFGALNLDEPDIVCLFYYVSACLSQPELQHGAILAIEGLTYYGVGKRLAVCTGMLLQLDSIVAGIDFHLFTRAKVQVLECYSNILCFKQLKYVAVDGDDLIAKLSAMRSVIQAVIHALSVREAQASSSCLFIFMYYRFDDFYQTCKEENTMEPLVGRLCQFSASFRENEGGQGSSMCLYLLVKGATQDNVALSEMVKTMLELAKELYCQEEMERILYSEYLEDQFELQHLESVCQQFDKQIAALQELQTDLLVEDEELNVTGRSATTGNMRSGKVRTSGRISSLDL